MLHSVSEIIIYIHVYVCVFFRSDIVFAIKKLLSFLSTKKTRALSLDWIFGIPLYSFLAGKFEPYEKLTSQTNEMLNESWTFLENHFQTVEKRRLFRAEDAKYVMGSKNGVGFLRHDRLVVP